MSMFQKASSSRPSLNSTWRLSPAARRTRWKPFSSLTGRATLVTPSGSAQVGPGSVVFVPAGEGHSFTEIDADLTLIVIFAPPYGSRASG